VTEPTEAALAWKRRADEAEARDEVVGLREICPTCARPIGMEWKALPACECPGEEAQIARQRCWDGGNEVAHGLMGEIARGDQPGTTTYG